jgi:hypothetical protein
MLASGPLYSSPTFWAGAGVAIGAATLLVIVTQWRAGTRRRVLTYSLVSDTALIREGTRERTGQDLKIVLGDKPLDEPHVVSIKIELRGREDIESANYDSNRSLTLDLGTSILKRLDQENNDKALPIAIDAERLCIGPGLIRSGDALTVDLLTAGPVQLTCPDPPLANVDIRESQADDGDELIWLKRLQAAAFTLCVIGILGWGVADGYVPFNFILIVFLLGGLGFAISIMRALIGVRRRHGREISVGGTKKQR